MFYLFWWSKSNTEKIRKSFPYICDDNLFPGSRLLSVENWEWWMITVYCKFIFPIRVPPIDKLAIINSFGLFLAITSRAFLIYFLHMNSERPCKRTYSAVWLVWHGHREINFTPKRTWQKEWGRHHGTAILTVVRMVIDGTRSLTEGNLWLAAGVVRSVK